MTSFDEATTEEIITILQKYVPYEFHDLNDWEQIIKRAKVTEWGDVEFKLNACVIVLHKSDLTYKDAFPFGNQE